MRKVSSGSGASFDAGNDNLSKFQSEGYYEVTLLDGPLGISLAANPQGNRLSAIVEKVTGQAEATNKIQEGHLLVAVNAKCTSELAFTETMSALKEESANRSIPEFVVNSPAPVHGGLNEDIMKTIANDDDAGVRMWLASPETHLEDTETEKNQTALCYSVRQGSAKCTKCLIEAKANVNAKMAGNATSLYLAAQESQREAIELLIKHGANINATTDNGASPIFVAALSNNRTCVEMLIEAGADVNLAAKSGATPLQMAREENFGLIAEVLLKAGAVDNNEPRPNTRKQRTGILGNSALFQPSASMKRMKVIVESYIQQVENVQSTASVAGMMSGFMTSSMAVATGSNKITLFKVSVSMFGKRWRIQKRFSEFKTFYETVHGLSRNLPFPTSTMPGYMFTESMLEQRRAQLHEFLQELVSLSNADTVVEAALYAFLEVRKHVSSALLEVQAAHAESEEDKEAVKRNGWTPLTLAAYQGQRDRVELMIKSGADVNTINPDTSTALQIAAMEGHAECVQLLVDANSQLDLPRRDGCTALWLASLNGHSECVEVLINAEADMNAVAEDGQCALIAAAWKGNSRVLQLLVQAKSDINSCDKKGDTALHVAALSGHLSSINTLIEKGNANVNYPNRVGDTPLCNAAGQGNTECLKRLIEAKADVTPAGNGHYAIYAAARHGHPDCLSLLIRAGANVRTGITMGRDGSTALHASARNGHRRCLSVLLNAGANVNEEDRDGTTALWVAARRGHEDCVSMMLNVGCTDALCLDGDFSGFTSMDIAIHYGHSDVVCVLRAAGATAPCKEPMTLLNKRVDVEGMGQGRVTDFDGVTTSGAIGAVGKGMGVVGKGTMAGVNAVVGTLSMNMVGTEGISNKLFGSNLFSIIFQMRDLHEHVKLLRNNNGGVGYTILDCPIPGPAYSANVNNNISEETSAAKVEDGLGALSQQLKAQAEAHERQREQWQAQHKLMEERYRAQEDHLQAELAAALKQVKQGGVGGASSKEMEELQLQLEQQKDEAEEIRQTLQKKLDGVDDEYKKKQADTMQVRAKLRKDNKTLQEERDIISEELQETKSKLAKAEQSLANALEKHELEKASIQENTVDLDKLKAEVEAAQEKLYAKEQQMQEQISTGKAELEQTKAEAEKKLSEEVRKKDDEIAAKVQQWEEAQTTLVKDLELKGEQNKQLEQLQQQLLEARSDLAEAKAATAAAQSEVAAAKSEAAAAATIAAAAGLDDGEPANASDGAIGEGGGEGGGAEGSEECEVSVEKLEAEVQQTKVQITRLTEEKEILYRQVAQEQDARTAWGAEKEHFKQRQTDLEQQISEQQEKLKVAEKEAKEMKEAIESQASTSSREQEQAVAEAEAKVTEISAEVAKVAEEKNGMQTQMDKLTAALEEQKESLADAMAVRGRLRQEKTEVEEELEKMKKSLKDREEDWQKDQVALEEQIATQRTELEKAKNDVAKFSQESEKAKQVLKLAVEKSQKAEEEKAKRKKKKRDEEDKEADPVKVEQLVAFYNKYDPPKASNADTLVSKYSIKALVKLLRNKYDDVPEGWDEEIKKEKADKKKKDSGTKPSPSTPAAAGGGDDNDKSDTAAAADTGAEASPASITEGSSEELERRKQALRAFYLAKDPSKISCIDQILSPTQEFPEVVQSLKMKYGEAPEGWELIGHREALVKFYNENDPKKFYTKEDMINTVDKLLAEYKFKDVVAALQDKYGKVPPGWEAELKNDLMGSFSKGLGNLKLWG